MDSLIGDLVDIVGKNGVLLLNIGPNLNGTTLSQTEKYCSASANG